MSEKTLPVTDHDENEYYSGCMYEQQDFWRFRPAKTYLSRVSITDEEVNELIPPASCNVRNEASSTA